MSSGWVSSNGYRIISVHGRRVSEHRYRMEQHLGRRLEPTEVVHHRDGNRLNNAIENLELAPSASDHRGWHTRAMPHGQTHVPQRRMATCPACARVYLTTAPLQIYCCRDCVVKAKGWVIRYCAVCPARITTGGTHRKFCSIDCAGKGRRGAAHGRYKGGILLPSGYYAIHLDGKRMLLHRHLMEKHLGRPLLAEEIVHHKDGNKLNNSLDNLEILSQRVHAKGHHFGYRSETEKQCRDCLEIKPRSEFRTASQPAGWEQHKSRCKSCLSAIERKQKEKRHPRSQGNS